MSNCFDLLDSTCGSFIFGIWLTHYSSRLRDSVIFMSAFYLFSCCYFIDKSFSLQILGVRFSFNLIFFWILLFYSNLSICSCSIFCNDTWLYIWRFSIFFLWAMGKSYQFSKLFIFLLIFGLILWYWFLYVYFLLMLYD